MPACNVDRPCEAHIAPCTKSWCYCTPDHKCEGDDEWDGSDRECDCTVYYCGGE